MSDETEAAALEALSAKMAETMTPKLNAMIAPLLAQARSLAIDDCIKVVLAVPDFTEFVREGFAEALRRFKASEALKEAK